MFLLTFIMVILFFIVGMMVLALGKKAKSVRVSELWKLFLGLILISLGFEGVFLNQPLIFKLWKIGILTFGITLVVWFAVSILRLCINEIKLNNRGLE